MSYIDMNTVSQFQAKNDYCGLKRYILSISKVLYSKNYFEYSDKLSSIARKIDLIYRDSMKKELLSLRTNAIFLTQKRSTLIKNIEELLNSISYLIKRYYNISYVSSDTIATELILNKEEKIISDISNEKIDPYNGLMDSGIDGIKLILGYIQKQYYVQDDYFMWDILQGKREIKPGEYHKYIEIIEEIEIILAETLPVLDNTINECKELEFALDNIKLKCLFSGLESEIREIDESLKQCSIDINDK